MQLKDTVRDWGGFEELVEDLHKSEGLNVQRDVTLTGKSGATRQIDVLIEHKQGPYEYRTLVECKYWNKKVERANIDVLYAGMQDLNAAKGVFFTTVGYQSGAETYAKSMGISIFVVRELTDEEWGLPGKVIDFYLQVVRKSIVKIEPFETKVSFAEFCVDRSNPGISLEFTENNDRSKNVLISKHKEKHKTFESLMEHVAEEAVHRYQKEPLLINGGEECTRYIMTKVNVPFSDELQVFNKDKIFFLPKLEMDVALKVTQSQIQIDRSSNYRYALAVVDCVNEQAFYATRAQDSEFSDWKQLKTASEPSSEHLVNGSIMTVAIKGFFPPDEVSQLVPTQVNF